MVRHEQYDSVEQMLFSVIRVRKFYPQPYALFPDIGNALPNFIQSVIRLNEIGDVVF